MKTRLLLLTSAALLLAACGQSAAPTSTTPVTGAPIATTPVTAPVATPAKPTPAFVGGKVYQVSFQGVNSGAMTSKLSLLSAPRVGGQALESVSDDFSFTLLSKATFTVQASGKRYVRATYQVTNNTGQTLTNLRFVPVNTDEDAAGPSNNNGNVPTVDSTSFNGVSYYDGSDASGKAGSLNAGQGMNFNAATGNAEADPNASAFASGLATGTLTPSAPQGLVIGDVKTYGWSVASTLAPSATANATFAVDLPLDSAGPSKDPFAFNLVFTAAQDGPVPIDAVQGSTPSGYAASPLSGQSLVTQGVVTSTYVGAGKLNGFFIETPDADQDSDSSTSEGLFVYCGDAASGVDCTVPKVGDLVRVAGTVAEYASSADKSGYAGTQLAKVSNLTVRSSGNALPTAASVSFPLSARGDLEKYEGMLLTVPTTMTVTDTYSLGRYGQLGLSSGGRVFEATNAEGNSAANALRRLVIDDGVTAQNPATIPFLTGSDPLTSTRRGGDTVTGLTGVLNYYSAATDFQLYPTAANFMATNPRPAAPKDVGGTLKVASANIENYFTQLATSNSGCTNDGANSTYSRGANDCYEFNRQLAKEVAELKGLNADVVSLMEVENGDVQSDGTTKVANSGDNALSFLVDALNKAYGSNVYAYIQTGLIGTDAIRVAMIYKPGSVTPALTDTGNSAQTYRTDSNSVYSRPPLAQTFTQNSNGEKFSVIANHFKSKGSCPSSASDSNADMGQGCWNVLRTQQADALLKFAASVQQTSGDQDVLLVGDLNSYAAEDPITHLINGGYESLNKRIDTADRYSYAFSGSFGYLDHALSSGSLGGQIVGITEWHINSDEPVIFDYNTEYKNNSDCKTSTCTSPDYNNVDGNGTPYRNSDHDPVLVGLNLTAAFKVNASGADSVTQGQSYTLNIGSNKAPDSLSVNWGDGSAAQTVTPNGTSTTATHTFTASGNYTITVTGTQGGASSSDTKTITVNAAPSASLSLSNSGNLSVQQGGSGSDTITVNAANSNSPVSLAATSDTAGVTVSLNPTSVSGSATTTSTASVSIGSGVAAGTVATITVTGMGDAGSKSTSFTVTATAAPVSSTPGKLVISQVYGGGGNAGAQYSNDFIELFNSGSAAVSLSGYSIQYASSAGTFNASNNYALSGTVQPGQYFLIQFGAGMTASAALPTPDAMAAGTNISAMNGKVALSRSTAMVSGSTDANVVDFVGFGTANDKEGTAAAPAPSNTTADLRAGNGCTDTNQNGNDFTAGAPNPRNSSSAANVCSGN